MVNSLWGEEFNIPTTQEISKKILNKLDREKEYSKKLRSKNTTLSEKLKLIKEEVGNVLGHYQNNTLVIKTKEELVSYIDKAIENGIIAIDTETNNSLDPITCKLMGACIYTPSLNQAYVPINHINVDSNERLEWQLNERDIKEQFTRLTNNIKILMHNGKFDYKVIKCTCGVELPIYWDTMVAARLIDENEPSAGLKQQYIDKINPDQEKYSIDYLFENVEYAQVDPNIFALYAATDAKMTYDLYEWQVKKFQDPELKGSYWIFRNVENPLIKVIAEMELTGLEIDNDYVERLSLKYHKKEEELEEKISEVLNTLESTIQDWRLTSEANKKELVKNAKNPKSKNEKLESPVNLDSPIQLSILLYDVLKMPQVSTTSPRGTGVNELKALLEKTHHPLCDLILQKRTLTKLLNTFIEALPKARNPKDNKIHCQFNQVGTDTGRFSSSEPNLQQIPRSNIEIKPMFKAPDGYSWVACDLSGAEVRTSANASKDKNMLQAYKEGQDLYSLIASKVYRNNYEDNLEFYPEGTKILFEGKEAICGKKTHINKAGKIRRQDSKSVLIGLIYGRGAKSISEQINESRLEKGQPLITKEDAQVIIDGIYQSFPRLKQWIEETHEFIHKNGYIDDVFGRRRRLPDGKLPKYKFETSSQFKNVNFNPLLGCYNLIDNRVIDKYKKKLENITYYKDYEKIKKEALNEGLEIHNNEGFIAQAERQAVNFQCQAASSDINKLSMLTIANDKRLKELGFQLLLTIHDEVIGQCPNENAEEVAKILPEIMTSVGGDKMVCPLVADSTIVKHWYQDDMEASLSSSYESYIEKGLSEEDAINNLVKEHTELLPSQIINLIKNQIPLWS